MLSEAGAPMHFSGNQVMKGQGCLARAKTTPVSLLCLFLESVHSLDQAGTSLLS